MAELVDALVSNTSGSDAVPVRSRLRVLQKPLTQQMLRGFFIGGGIGFVPEIKSFT